MNIENISAGDDDVIDLTSPDYSLSGQSITVDGEGNDMLWGSDANETLKGGANDVLFGGAGVNELLAVLEQMSFSLQKHPQTTRLPILIFQKATHLNFSILKMQFLIKTVSLQV